MILTGTVIRGVSQCYLVPLRPLFSVFSVALLSRQSLSSRAADALSFIIPVLSIIYNYLLILPRNWDTNSGADQLSGRSKSTNWQDVIFGCIGTGSTQFGSSVIYGTCRNASATGWQILSH